MQRAFINRKITSLNFYNHSTLPTRPRLTILTNVVEYVVDSIHTLRLKELWTFSQPPPPWHIHF
jgi:hypothetical protein